MPTRLSKSEPGKVLVLVDQPSVAELIKLTLNHGVYLARDVATAQEAATLLADWEPHLAIVEVGVGGDGQLLEAIGRAIPGQVRLPVLALTRRGDLKTKLAAFERGVDDVLVIPFSPEELLARVMVITRRTYGEAVELTPVLHVGDLEIDILNRQVRIGDTILHLTAVEQSLLYLLAANAGKLLTRDEITDAIWGADFVADSNIVDRHVRNLRVKLGDRWRRPRYVATVAGQGYRFLVDAASSA